uniref:HotDog ACOT-type domain-containing protein n=1 Tax=Megaselia scalaris TaxID=36166 RepID=T1H3X4_MEGSC
FQKIIQPKSLKIFQYKSFSNDIPRPENLATAGTMSDVYEKILKRLGAEPGYREVPQSREHLLQYQPAAEDLPARTMADSFASAIIPLSSSKNLQDKYVNWLGYARLGKLIQDMDGFAVWVCQQHLLIPNLDESIHLPYTFVTILVDRIDFDAFRPKGTTDIRLSGHVSWVGRSSMEVVVWLEQEFEGKYKKITRALFLMAARNATNTGPAPINPLVPGNDKEKEILAGGEKRKQLRLESQNQSLLKVVPNSYEQALMHDLFIRTTSKETIQLNKRMLPDNSKWMKHCSNSNTIPCFSEYRNAQKPFSEDSL